MATAHFQQMAFQPQHNASNQCVDPSEMDNWVDFGSLTSPTPSSNAKGKMPAVSAHSAMTSPTSTAIPLDADDQTPVAPAHDYGRFKQQTGLPTGSIESLRALNENQHVFANFNSGIDEFSFGNFDGMGSQNGFGSMTGDMGLDSSMPAFFYPNDSQTDDFVDPTAIQTQEEAQANIRYYPGMHQQAAQMRAQQAAAQRQQMLAAQKQREQSESQQRRKASPVDAHAEETIARVVNQIRQNSMMHASMSPEGQGMMPTMIKKHKDDDDMDEDERLLNSEEGKKLSSKERRQLRNKVSARAFRSRRKEYISQLEGEVQQKVNEAAELKLQNRALMEENARFRSLSEKLLAHAAFRPFLEELSRDPEMASSFAAVVNNSVPASQSQSATPQPQIKKDPNPYENFNGAQFSQNTQHVGMTLVPEPQVDFSQLSWGINNMGLQQQNSFQPQVFAVTSIPEEPVDISVLSGKYAAEEEAVEETFESAKADLPAEIETPAKDMPAEVEEKAVEPTVETADFDAEDPAFTLFASSAPASAEPTLDDAMTLLSHLPTEKPSHFEMVSSNESAEMSTVFDKSCARLDAACRRLDSLFSSFGL